MYQNYIFDLYGTLIDIRTDEYSKNFYKKYVKWLKKQRYFFEWKLFYRLYTSIERQYRENARQESEFIKPEICVDDVFRKVFEAKGYKVSDQEIVRLCENFRSISLIHMCLFPDTIACLDGLKKAGKKIYLLSNAQRSFTWAELEHTGLVPYFDGILISSDEGCMKPDPEFYNICCERYGLDKSQSIMIGNELKSDMVGAKAAGIDGFYINRTPVFHKVDTPIYQYVSENGSLLEVLTQTGIDL